MNPTNPFPKAILHVDGDAFFASCEVAKNPGLKGQPIVVGQERGIATAVSYEAKALGVVRGMTMRHIREKFPSVLIVGSDYESYAIFSRKMYAIVRRYTPHVEEYSIDECFADLSAIIDPIKDDQVKINKVIEIGTSIKKALDNELNVSFSIGISVTKVLAKVASKWNKPSGFSIITFNDIEKYLEKFEVKKIWGIGSSTAHYLKKQGIETSLQFIQQSRQWLDFKCNKPLQELWYELKGVSLFAVNNNHKDFYKSVSKTGTFKPTYNKNLLFSELSKNIERMCVKLRAYKLKTRRISFFIKTQNFSYHGREIALPEALDIPTKIITLIKPYFDMVYVPGTLYRATGIRGSSIVDNDHTQQDLFGNSTKLKKLSELFKVNDEILEKNGRGSIFLASSLQSIQESRKNRSMSPDPIPKFTIPFMGEVK